MIHFLIWKKNVVNEKTLPATQLIHHLPNLDRKEIHSWSSTGLLPGCCWSLRRSQWIDWISGDVRCEFPMPNPQPLFSAGQNGKLQVGGVLFFGWGMQKKGPTFFFEHQHITALRELLTSCSGSTQSYFLFLACCNNWCNWCQTSSGWVSNQSRIFSNTGGHSPFSCSICIWAHANDPVNWRVDSGSDFCIFLDSAVNCHWHQAVRTIVQRCTLSRALKKGITRAWYLHHPGASAARSPPISPRQSEGYSKCPTLYQKTFTRHLEGYSVLKRGSWKWSPTKLCL